jgi:hypothetical protein
MKKRVLNSCLELANKADNGTLKNEDIRNKIVEIIKNAKCSIGQTQKNYQRILEILLYPYKEIPRNNKRT